MLKPLAELYREALEIQRAEYGEVHSEVGHVLNNLAGLLYNLGRYTAAEAMSREALALYRELYPDPHAALGRAYHNLGRDVQAVEQRLAHLKDQRNLLRTRQARAEALSSVARASQPLAAEVGEVFERWETRVMERELEGECAVSDEGDDSRRMSQSDTDPTEAYVRPIQALAPGATVSALIPLPDLSTGAVICSGLGTPLGAIERLLETVASTGGRAFPVAREDADGECALTDFGEVMGAWVAGL